jgi:hypothetical protein
MPLEKKYVSVVVVKNDRGIKVTLDHLHAFRQDIDFETIVVDASEPNRLADIRNKHGWVIWDQFPVSSKRTTPEQRNRGLEIAQGEIIIFIDANCIPAEKWLATIISSIESGQDIICGPVLNLSENNLVHYAQNLSEGEYVDVCTTINVGFRRRVIETIGIFDTSFSFGQDVDFFWRARDAGFKIYYDPLVAIGHDWGEKKEQLQRAFEYGKSRAHLFKKHWHNRKNELLHESHVWIYPLFILGLPITFFIPYYPLILLIPIIKNRTRNPLGLVLHHLVYGFGVIVGTLKTWPTETYPVILLTDELVK